MNKLMLMLVMSLVTLLYGGKAFALGVDVGPVHVHSESATENLKVVIETAVKHGVDPLPRVQP